MQIQLRRLSPTAGAPDPRAAQFSPSCEQGASSYFGRMAIPQRNNSSALFAPQREARLSIIRRNSPSAKRMPRATRLAITPSNEEKHLRRRPRHGETARRKRAGAARRNELEPNFRDFGRLGNRHARRSVRLWRSAHRFGFRPSIAAT